MVSAYPRSSASGAGRSPMLKAALSPLPMPSRVRPGASSSSVAAAHAATAGWRVIGVMTRGPRRMRSVLTAHSASVM